MDLDFQNTFVSYCIEHPFFLAFSFFCFYCGIEKIAFISYWMFRSILRRFLF